MKGRGALIPQGAVAERHFHVRFISKFCWKVICNPAEGSLIMNRQTGTWADGEAPAKACGAFTEECESFMAIEWHFVSYNLGRFQQVFGKASELEEAALLKVLEYELGAEPEDELGVLARKIAHEGIQYKGMNPRDAEALDQIIGVCLSQEGLWNELELEQEMQEGFPHPIVLEMLRKAQQANLKLEWLPILKGGRRFRSDLGPECRYFMIERVEVPKLAQEARQILALPGPWSSEQAPNQIMDQLIMVCEFIARKQRPMAGVLS